MREFRTANNAYKGLLEELLRNGSLVDPISDSTSVGSRFGEVSRGTLEIVGYGFRISEPRDRLITTAPRKFNLGFAFANTLWVLRGADDLDSIRFYNPRGEAFSDDGRLLAGAFGNRLFRSIAGDQVKKAKSLLRTDPASRRAVLQIFLPTDLGRGSRDTPCSIALQCLVRENSLILVVFMRSQSAVMVLPYDIFLFTMLQEVLALELGVGVGSYVHICGSLHVYDDEQDLLQVIVRDHTAINGSAMRAMAFSPLQDSRVFDAEAAVRMFLRSDPWKPVNLGIFQLDEYWSSVITLLAIAGRQCLGAQPLAEELLTLPAIYRAFYERPVSVSVGR